LSSAHGSGSVRGKPPESTHCNNIGRAHRKEIHAALKEWFGIEAKEPEKPQRRDASELWCLEKGESPGTGVGVGGKIADERIAAARAQREKFDGKGLSEALANEWKAALQVQRKGVRIVVEPQAVVCPLRGVDAKWCGASVLLLLPHGKKNVPVTVAFGQGG